MVTPEALRKFGSTDTRLRAVFTRPIGEKKLNDSGQMLLKDMIKKREDARALEMTPIEVEEGKHRLTTKEKKDIRMSLLDDLEKWNKHWSDRIQPRLENGRLFGLKNYRFYMAGDLAWNSAPLTDASTPIMAWAQGKISIDECVTQVKDACTTPEDADKYFLKNDKGKVTGIVHDRLTDIPINLCRPYIRRSVASLANAYNDLHPFLKYDARIRSLVGQLRGDLVSERVEIMTDQFGYRRLHTQMSRRMFLHGSSTAFVQAHWERKKAMRHNSADDSVKEVIETEGVPFALPHPTRIFYDQSSALPSLNFDRGPTYAGYWDCVAYGTVKNDPAFFNTHAIPYSDKIKSLESYAAYFNFYYEKSLKVPAAAQAASGLQRAEAFYGSETGTDDESMWLTHYYDHIIPREHGLGDYPHPVWLHLVVAGDDTVVYADFLPSRPGFVYSYDEDDGQLLSVSKALDILPYQEQVQSLFSQVTFLMRLTSMLIVMADEDLLDEVVIDSLQTAVEGKQLTARTHLIKWSSQMKELLGEGTATKKPLEIFQAKASQNISDLMKVIGSLIAMLEKNQMMGPNEMGQFNQRETSASESMIVDKSAGSLASYKSEGVDEGRQGLKVILYESTIAHGSKDVRLSVPERYPEDVIKAAGFEVEPTPEGYIRKDPELTITGTTNELIHEYAFTSRDGKERAVSIESAKLIMELIRYVFTNELALKSFISMFGPDQISKAISEIFRLSGSPMTLKLSTAFSEKDLEEALSTDEFRKNVTEAMGKLGQEVGQIGQRLGDVEGVAEHYVAGQEGAVPPEAPQN